MSDLPLHSDSALPNLGNGSKTAYDGFGRESRNGQARLGVIEWELRIPRPSDGDATHT